MDQQSSNQTAFDALENKWQPTPDTGDEAPARRAQALAHATLIQTSMKVAHIRAAAQSTLLDAHTQAQEVLAAAHDEADALRQAAEANADAITLKAHDNATAITDRALDQRDMLLTATLDRVAELSTKLIGMADQIVAHSEDPVVARSQLANFVLELTHMAEQVDGFSSADTVAADAGLAFVSGSH